MDEYDGGDPQGLLKGLVEIYNGNARKHAFQRAWDQWDNVYGVGKKDFEVYILANESMPGEYTYGPLTLYHKPFYVGKGKRDRSIESAAVGRQRDKGGEKVQYLEEMQQQNQNVKIYIINRFYTEQKANIVEMKLLKLIPKSELTNCEFPYCELSLNTIDFIQPEEVLFV